MPAPELSGFGDGTHAFGETGLVVDGGGLGAFPGSLWIFENSDLSGAADQLTVGGWNDLQLTGVEIPATPNNSAGTRYLAVQREDLAWSVPLAFTLEDTVVVLSPAGLVQEQALEAPTIVIAGVLTPQDIVAIQTLGAVSLTQDHNLVVADIVQLQELEAPTASPADALTVLDIDQAQEVAAPGLTQDHGLTVGEILQEQSLDAVSIVIEGQLQPLDLAQLQALDAGDIQQTHILGVLDIVQLQSLQAPGGTPARYLTVTSIKVLPSMTAKVSIKSQ